MSRSLQSAIECLGGSKRWSRNESDIVPWKSSIGEISSKISSKPDFEGSSPRFVLVDCARRARHRSFPSNQSTLSTCSASRLGTSSGSRIFANEIRRGAVELFFAAKRCPSRQNSLLCGHAQLEGRRRYMQRPLEKYAKGKSNSSPPVGANRVLIPPNPPACLPFGDKKTRLHAGAGPFRLEIT